MRVRATKLGYYNHRRRRENEEFEIVKEIDFSKRWMVKVEEETPKVEPEVKRDAPEPEASKEVI